jgi:hypothetical protein
MTSVSIVFGTITETVEVPEGTPPGVRMTSTIGGGGGLTIVLMLIVGIGRL